VLLEHATVLINHHMELGCYARFWEPGHKHGEHSD
jgi:hypothetical protein